MKGIGYDDLKNRRIKTNDILNKSIRSLKELKNNPSPKFERPGTHIVRPKLQHVKLPIIKNPKK